MLFFSGRVLSYEQISIRNILSCHRAMAEQPVGGVWPAFLWTCRAFMREFVQPGALGRRERRETTSNRDENKILR